MSDCSTEAMAPKEKPETLDSLTLQLIRAYYDDDCSFDEAAKRVASYYNDHERWELSEYVRAQLPGAVAVISTMELDPISKIARDMYAVIERECGADGAESKEFRIRLGSYFPDFMRRCMDERLVKPFKPA